MEKQRLINFNSFLNFLALGALTWIAVTLTQVKAQQESLNVKIAVMESVKDIQVKQLNRIEDEVGRLRGQQAVLSDELSRLKGLIK